MRFSVGRVHEADLHRFQRALPRLCLRQQHLLAHCLPLGTHCCNHGVQEVCAIVLDVGATMSCLPIAGSEGAPRARNGLELGVEAIRALLIQKV
ncbi:hypothetical protein EON66_07900 [archaeon]|nr:MAG: hypothetical protein EON66_07900 [archaeon]